MPLYTFTFGHQTGLCCAIDKRDAYRHMMRELGRTFADDLCIERATKDDEAWFTHMGGGFVYETRRAWEKKLYS